MSEDIPAELRPTLDLLSKAFGAQIDDEQYSGLIAFLADHMCEENIGLTVGVCFHKDPVVVVNDLARVLSVAPPSKDVVSSVRSRLQSAGLAEWLEDN